MNKIFSIVIASLCLTSISCSILENRGNDEAGNDYIVYSTFCQYFIDTLSENKIEVVVLREETYLHESISEINEKENIKRLQGFLPTLEPSTISDFFLKT